MADTTTEPRVLTYPADTAGCGSYRIIWPAEALNAQGMKVDIAPPGHDRRLQAHLTKPDGQGRMHVAHVVDPQADIVVFQRPLSRMFYEAMVQMKGAGIRIVIELDDDFKAVSPRNSAFRAVHPAHSPDSNWTWLERALKVCDLVVASSESIARRYAPKHTPRVVIPNFVPEAYLGIERPDHGDEPWLGWAGSGLSTHPDDMQVVRGAVAEAMRRTGTGSFRMVGRGDGAAHALGLDEEQVLATGWVPPDRYAEFVARFDVSMAPLETSTFNDGKSWLKPLELAAVGVPCVMSPAAEYRRLLDEHGIGVIASKPAQWRHHLTALLSDHDARRAESERLREVVRTHQLTIEANAKLWWDAWTSVL